jgi:hypothetical protein
MGTFQKNARKAAKRARSPIGDPTLTANRAGGVAFEITDPSEKLLTMVGARLDITEPSFYSAESCSAKRLDPKNREKLDARVEVNTGKFRTLTDVDGLDDVAQEILATAVSVLDSENPRDVLAIANWLRNEMHLRLTPAILLVIASMHPKGKEYVQNYATKVVQRPDDIKNALLFWRYIQGTKAMPKSLGRGLGDALSKFGERALMKYDSSNFPTWKDVLRWLPRKKGYPLAQALREYFVNGVVSEEGTPIAYNRKALAKCTELNAEAMRLIKKTRATWENVLSQFGKTAAGKKAAWEYLVKTGMVGYMAALRNLRNLVEADVSPATIEKIASKLANPDEVRKSKQLPFRFLSAAEAIDKFRGSKFSKLLDPVFSAVEEAVEVACENVPELPGTTVVFADNSGSMNTGVSQKSKMSCRDAANMLAGIIAKRGERAYVCAFSASVLNFRVTKRTTALGLAQSMAKKCPPSSTNTHLCFDWLMKQDIVADRIILLSDMQAWYSGGGYWGSYNESRNVAIGWEQYKRMCGKVKPWMHSVHLNGYGDNPTPVKDPHVNLISGFSENIIRMLLNTEAGMTDARAVAQVLSGEELEPEAPKDLPTIEQIRANW